MAEDRTQKNVARLYDPESTKKEGGCREGEAETLR